MASCRLPLPPSLPTTSTHTFEGDLQVTSLGLNCHLFIKSIACLFISADVALNKILIKFKIKLFFFGIFQKFLNLL